MVNETLKTIFLPIPMLEYKVKIGMTCYLFDCFDIYVLGALENRPLGIGNSIYSGSVSAQDSLGV